MHDKSQSWMVLLLFLNGVSLAGEGTPPPMEAAPTPMSVEPGPAAPGTTTEDPKAPEEDPLEFKVFWKDGLNFQTLNKAIKMKIGGRIHNDWAWFNVSDDLGEPADGGFDFEDGTQFRRARLRQRRGRALRRAEPTLLGLKRGLTGPTLSLGSHLRSHESEWRCCAI